MYGTRLEMPGSGRADPRQWRLTARITLAAATALSLAAWLSSSGHPGQQTNAGKASESATAESIATCTAVRADDAAEILGNPVEQSSSGRANCAYQSLGQSFHSGMLQVSLVRIGDTTSASPPGPAAADPAGLSAQGFAGQAVSGLGDEAHIYSRRDGSSNRELLEVRKSGMDLRLFVFTTGMEVHEAQLVAIARRALDRLAD